MEAVFAIPVGLGLGYLGDRTFGTYPICLLVGGVIGFSAFVVRLVRLGRELQFGSDGTGSDGTGSNGAGDGGEGESASEPRDEK